MTNNYYEEIEAIYRRNLETRFMNRIYLPNMLSASVESLMASTHVVIVTGFVVKDALAGETDGPPGALALAKVLEAMGKVVTLVTDTMNASLLISVCKLLNLKSELILVSHENYKGVSDKLLNSQDLSHIVAIERPSQASDGAYYSMRGEDISDFVANTDYLINQAPLYNVKTIGIGDGGNEVGMANVREDILKYVPKGEQICASTQVDFLIIAGVSNWGAYGICAGLSILTKKMLLPTNQTEIEVLKELVEEGAVDGFDKVAVMKVDGIDLTGNLDILSAIREVVSRYI